MLVIQEGLGNLRREAIELSGSVQESIDCQFVVSDKFLNLLVLFELSFDSMTGRILNQWENFVLEVHFEVVREIIMLMALGECPHDKFEKLVAV